MAMDEDRASSRDVTMRSFDDSAAQQPVRGAPTLRTFSRSYPASATDAPRSTHREIEAGRTGQIAPGRRPSPASIGARRTAFRDGRDERRPLALARHHRPDLRTSQANVDPLFGMPATGRAN